MRVLRFVWLLAICPAVGLATGDPGDQATISDVGLSRATFNPDDGDTVQLKYNLATAGKVTVHVYDPDGGLIRTVTDAAECQAGAHTAMWDGKDVDGHVVPDEAYTFTIETADHGVYDPTTFSGGIVGDIVDGRFDHQAGTVVYKLAAASRVLIRLGVRNGPMLKTLVDWKPRVVGNITEYWDGFDENKAVRFHDHKGFSALITYVTLPEATVIAFGNDKQTYRDYKKNPTLNRPQKPKRPRQPDSQGRLCPENLVPAAWAQSPKLLISFPKLDKEGMPQPPTAKAIVDVHLDVNASDKEDLQREQFEIIFYVDHVFFAEAERGFLPFNWRWELNQIPEGDHVLTVNISSFRGQVGVASRKIHVAKDTK